MANAWVEFVRQYAKKNNISYGFAISEAGPEYRKMKAMNKTPKEKTKSKITVPKEKTKAYKDAKNDRSKECEEIDKLASIIRISHLDKNFTETKNKLNVFIKKASLPYEIVKSKQGLEKLKKQILRDILDPEYKRCFDFIQNRQKFFNLREILEELAPEKVDEINDLVDARNEILEDFEKIT